MIHCPFCGGTTKTQTFSSKYIQVCVNEGCAAHGPVRSTADGAKAAMRSFGPLPDILMASPPASSYAAEPLSISDIDEAPNGDRIWATLVGVRDALQD